MPRKKYNIHYVYKTTCLITKRFYIGIHSTLKIDDGYLGSGIILRRSIRKYGKDNHIKEIIEFFPNRKETELMETSLINENKNDKLCMNLTDGGKGFKMNHTEKTKMKISDKLSNKTYEEIHGIENADIERKKRSISAKKQWETMDDDTKKSSSDKISNSLKNYYKTHPEARIQKEYMCPHCGKVGRGNGMLRYHFDNCKIKINL
jgi:hypothetical protein